MAKTRKKTRSKAAKSKSQAVEHGDHGHGEHSHEAHYIKIWKILVVLLVVSVIGPMLEMKVLTLLTAFGIACVKAFLVVKHFMHLNLEKRFVAYFVATALAFMFLFYAGTSPDVMNHTGRNWSNVAAKAETKRALKKIEEQKALGGGHH
jgi:caa(3)-type oxidase subunit IV